LRLGFEDKNPLGITLLVAGLDIGENRLVGDLGEVGGLGLMVKGQLACSH